MMNRFGRVDTPKHHDTGLTLPPLTNQCFLLFCQLFDLQIFGNEIEDYDDYVFRVEP